MPLGARVGPPLERAPLREWFWAFLRRPEAAIEHLYHPKARLAKADTRDIGTCGGEMIASWTMHGLATLAHSRLRGGLQQGSSVCNETRYTRPYDAEEEQAADGTGSSLEERHPAARAGLDCRPVPGAGVGDALRRPSCGFPIPSCCWEGLLQGP